MFGDIIHGLLMLMFAMYLIMNEAKYKNHDFGEIFDMIYGSRYLLLTMGLSATYMGFIYNEALSISLTLFGPSAYEPFNDHHQTTNPFPDRPYIFGVDPVWRHSMNNIAFTNSLKMKMSVIIGVSQMTLGIVLKLFNHAYFGRYVEVLVESVPEVLFMTVTFGYMCGLVVLKWSINYPEHPACFAPGCEGILEPGGIYPRRAAPPAIITTMIAMFKMEPLQPRHYMYAGQENFQRFLLTIAVASLPVLLIGKPLYIKSKMDAAKQPASYSAVSSDGAEGYAQMGDEEGAAAGGEEEDEDNFTDICVHQGIHTIEFALGCVSNTASYLRLWALSLAHSQLSEVFWEYIFYGYEFSIFGKYPGIGGGPYALIPCTFIFIMCTLGILMGMESLSAFLHALSLQWVEFQSKYYSADGKAFEPLSFETTVSEKNE
jgi:V-type H+-transporting ATPase subunit a